MVKTVVHWQGTTQKAVKIDTGVIKLIARNPNLIGYVSSSVDMSSVKVVENF